MWGQEVIPTCNDLNNRIIPTRVGTRVYIVIALAFVEDHPHACGDKAKSGSSGYKSPGSSPRVWGQVCRYSCRRDNFKDHPHACGDKRVDAP